MTQTTLAPFESTIQTTNIWLNDILERLGWRDLPQLSLAQSVRRPESRRHEAPQGLGEGEQPAEEGSGRSDPGQADPAGGHSGKLLSPARKRQTTKRVQQLLKVSERRACTALGWARSSQRYVPRTAVEEQRLVKRLRALSRQHPRYG